MSCPLVGNGPRSTSQIDKILLPFMPELTHNTFPARQHEPPNLRRHNQHETICLRRAVLSVHEIAKRKTMQFREKGPKQPSHLVQKPPPAASLGTCQSGSLPLLSSRLQSAACCIGGLLQLQATPPAWPTSNLLMERHGSAP